ncbi:MAG TPA: YciI family protein [Bacteroidota bacterium]|nr:YciI family protein [Bacteroidota bacterium]
MKEFMFFIRKQANSEETLSPDQHQKFLKGCEAYIAKLKSENKLISAQPIEWKGGIVSGKEGAWTSAPYNEGKEVIGGYYHILAADLNEAMEIAKANPEFQYNKNTRIEVRPIKMKEDTTGFVYPKG